MGHQHSGQRQSIRGIRRHGEQFAHHGLEHLHRHQHTRAFNYSGSNTADRALGTSPTSGAGNILQLVLANGIGGPVSTVQVAYNIRRFANATSPETIPGYRLFVSVNGGSTWSPVAALDPTSITLPNTVGTSTFSQSVTLPAAVPAGGQLRLRWVDDNSASSSVDQRIGLTM